MKISDPSEKQNQQGYRFTRHDVIFEFFEDTFIALHFGSGKYYRLNKEASALAALLHREAIHPESLNDFKYIYPDKTKEVAQLIDWLLREEVVEYSPLAAPEPDWKNALKLFLSGTDTGKMVVEVFDDLKGLLQYDPIYNVDDKNWPLNHD